MNKAILAVAIFLAASASGIEPALAAQPKHDSQPGGAFEGRELRSPIELANIPSYPGKTRYQAGVIFPHASGGVSYNMRFVAEDDAQTVLSFYRQTLSSSGWTLDQRGSAGTTLAAIDKNGNIAQVTVFSSYPNGKVHRTEFLLLFKAAGS